jgi:hypothetical protein
MDLTRGVQTKPGSRDTLRAFELHELALPWKADASDPLTPTLTKGDGLPDRGAAGRFDTE